MARTLPDFGWTPHVLTASPPDEHPPIADGTVTHIRSSERGFGGGIRIGESGASTLGQSPTWLRGLDPLKAFLPLERQLTWFPSFFKQAESGVNGREIRAVVTTAAPYVCLLLGHWLSRKLQVPHIVDIRDDWQDRFRIERRSALNRILMEAYAGHVLREATAVTTVSGPLAKRLRDYGTPVRIIPNGYVEADFTNIPMAVTPVPSSGPLRMVHMGWLGDFRSIEPVLSCLQQLRAEGCTGKDICFEQFGLIEENQERLMRGASLEDMVRIYRQVDHHEAVDEMKRADVLLAIPGSGISAAVSGKLYEYLRVRRPILLYAGKGAAMDLAKNVGLHWQVNEGDQDGLVRSIRDLIRRKRTGTLSTNTHDISQFERKNGVKKLANILNQSVVRSAEVMN